MTVGRELVLLGMVNGRGKVGDRALLVLTVMSVVAWDTGRDPGRYWGGWRLACVMLGWPETEVGRKRYTRAVAELRAAGLIESDGNHGRERRWRLTYTATDVGHSGVPR